MIILKSFPGIARIGIVCLCLVGVPALTWSQNQPTPLNSPSQKLLDRLMIMGVNPEGVHSALKPYHRGDVFDAAYADADSALPVLLRQDLSYLLAENDEFYFTHARDSLNPLLAGPPQSRRAFLKYFYRRPAHLYALDEPGFYLRVNPMLHFGVGSESSSSDLLYVNRRGIEIRGGIDDRLFFQTNIIEAQLRPSSYIQKFVDDYRALPDAGLFKDFDGKLFPGEGAYDYLTSNGVIGFQVLKHVGVQFGHGKNFIGDGYRSLFLSDFAKNSFYLRLNTRVWKIHYQNLFTELAASEKLPGNTLVPKKYMAAHYLSLRIHPNINIGLFESVIFTRDGGNFELQYLNPIILYRSIEHHVGSPDNVLLGLSASWNLLKKARLYGQFIVDEFKFNEFFSSDQWWGNKFGVQLGGLYVDAFGIRNLDVRLEYNQVRPFTYTHYDSLGSYSHLNQALAHPVGANFREVLGMIDYRPIPKLWLTGKAFFIKGGDDTADLYFGKDILRSNTERNADYGIAQGQGIPIKTVLFSLEASYMLKHNFFLEARYFRRDFTSDLETENLLSQYVSLGIRWNYFGSQEEF